MIDATENDSNTPYEVTGFPTLYFYQKGNKASPVKFNGGRDLESLKQFVDSNRKSTPSAKGHEEL